MSTITLEQINWTPAPRRSTVRLTRRGRLVVFVIALLAVLTVGILLAQGSVATGEKGTPAPTRVVMVGAGDTLWDIASGIAADGDVRGVMQEIEDLNDLESSSLAAGQKLRVPVQD